MENRNEVDVNVLIKLYNSKLSALTNQNVLLEAKLTTLTQDYKEQIESLLQENADLREQLEEKPE
jgi:benzoyl-CoA reductase/2-hydroxyglutaryl-CoA dehydratase subunit BcrC/BadD/HgdB